MPDQPHAQPPVVGGPAVMPGHANSAVVAEATAERPELVPASANSVMSAFMALNDLCNENEALRAEVRQLQAELAVARGAAWCGPQV